MGKTLPDSYLNSELRLPQMWEVKKVNPTNNQFLKGHVPHNKGKKWNDWMDGRKKRKVLKNLSEGRKLGHTPHANSLRNRKKRKPVLLIHKGIVKGRFECSGEAENKTGICARNIRSCCNGKRKNAGKFQWKFDR